MGPLHARLLGHLADVAAVLLQLVLQVCLLELLARLAQDLAGGLVVTLPSQQDMEHDELGPLLEKYLQGREGVSTEERVRILRLIENMTLGRNSVGYLTESLHGAGSPQAQRIQIARQMDIETKKRLAKRLAGIEGE